MSAAVSWFAAVMGGNHRLTNFDPGEKYRFIK